MLVKGTSCDERNLSISKHDINLIYRFSFGSESDLCKYFMFPFMYTQPSIRWLIWIHNSWVGAFIFCAIPVRVNVLFQITQCDTPHKHSKIVLSLMGLAMHIYPPECLCVFSPEAIKITKNKNFEYTHQFLAGNYPPSLKIIIICKVSLHLHILYIINFILCYIMH